MRSIEEILHDLRPEANFIASRDFIGDGILDSFDIVMLVSELDRLYGISIAGVDILPEHFRDIDSIKELVGKYRNSA